MYLSELRDLIKYAERTRCSCSSPVIIHVGPLTVTVKFITANDYYSKEQSGDLHLRCFIQEGRAVLPDLLIIVNDRHFPISFSRIAFALPTLGPLGIPRELYHRIAHIRSYIFLSRTNSSDPPITQNLATIFLNSTRATFIVRVNRGSDPGDTLPEPAGEAPDCWTDQESQQLAEYLESNGEIPIPQIPRNRSADQFRYSPGHFFGSSLQVNTRDLKVEIYQFQIHNSPFGHSIEIAQFLFDEPRELEPFSILNVRISLTQVRFGFPIIPVRHRAPSARTSQAPRNPPNRVLRFFPEQIFLEFREQFNVRTESLHPGSNESIQPVSLHLSLARFRLLLQRDCTRANLRDWVLLECIRWAHDQEDLTLLEGIPGVMQLALTENVVAELFRQGVLAYRDYNELSKWLQCNCMGIDEERFFRARDNAKGQGNPCTEQEEVQYKQIYLRQYLAVCARVCDSVFGWILEEPFERVLDRPFEFPRVCELLNLYKLRELISVARKFFLDNNNAAILTIRQFLVQFRQHLEQLVPHCRRVLMFLHECAQTTPNELPDLYDDLVIELLQLREELRL